MTWQRVLVTPRSSNWRYILLMLHLSCSLNTISAPSSWQPYLSCSSLNKSSTQLINYHLQLIEAWKEGGGGRLLQHRPTLSRKRPTLLDPPQIFPRKNPVNGLGTLWITDLAILINQYTSNIIHPTNIFPNYRPWHWMNFVFIVESGINK